MIKAVSNPRTAIYSSEAKAKKVDLDYKNHRTKASQNSGNKICSGTVPLTF